MIDLYNDRGGGMKKITYVMLLITLFILIIFEFNIDKSLAKENEEVNLNILTIDKSQYEMVKKIVGNKHNVKYLYSDLDEELNEECDIELIKNFEPDIIFYSSLNCHKVISNINKELENIDMVDISRGICVLEYEFKNNLYYCKDKHDYLIHLYNIESAINYIDPSNRDYYKNKYNQIRAYSSYIMKK